MSFLGIYPHFPWSPDPELYDCSNRTMDEWLARGKPQPFMGIFSIVFGTSALFLYVLTIIAMSNREFLQISCYQLMYYTSILDIINLFFSNVALGYFFVVGAIFCTHPTSNFLIGGIATGTWCGSCLAIAVLGFSRLAEVTGYCKWLFNGKMVIFWIGASVGFAVFVTFMTHTAVFNSALGSWLFIPVITDDFATEIEHFKNIIHPFTNVITAISIVSAYALIFIYLTISQMRNNDNKFSKLQRKLFLQSTLICSCLAICCGVYAYLELYPTPPWFILFAQGTYQTCECTPLISYLIFNNAIRRKVMIMLGLKKYANNKVYTTSNAHSSAIAASNI